MEYEENAKRTRAVAITRSVMGVDILDGISLGGSTRKSCVQDIFNRLFFTVRLVWFENRRLICMANARLGNVFVWDNYSILV